MTTDDLHTALRAAIGHRLERARRMERMAQEYQLEVQEPKLLGKHVPGWGEWPEVEQMAHQLAEVCEADLRRLERHTETSSGCCLNCCDGIAHAQYGRSKTGSWPCADIRDLADSLVLDIPGSQP